MPPSLSLEIIIVFNYYCPSPALSFWLILPYPVRTVNFESMPLKGALLSSEWIPRISEERKSLLQLLQQRHENISSNINHKSTVDSYIDTKQNLLTIRDKHARIYSSGLQESLKIGKITKTEYDALIAQINAELLEISREQVIIKRSKRTFSHDVKELVPCYSSLEDAYQKMVVLKVFSFSKAGHVRQSQNDRKALLKNVYETYQSRRQKPGEPPGDFIREEFWCPVTRKWWLGPSEAGRPPSVKVAHIVPQSFIHVSGQTMRMFDEDTASLAVNPRNALPMLQAIKERFDSLDVVVVPMESAQGRAPVEFQCVLANKSIAEMTVTEDYKWKDLDGAPLEFVNNFRPACRYLYFKYCVTYLYWKQKGETAWAKSLEGRQGYIWATPGTYIRRSMLLSLTRGSEDFFLPEAFYLQHTFEDDETSSGKVADVDHQSFESDLREEILRVDKIRRVVPYDDEGNEDEDENEDEDDDEY